MRLLMVCLGNICRSPIAEELVYHKCLELGLSVEVDSAGTAGYHIGSAPDPRMIETAAFFGHDISKQKARQFTPKDFDCYDYIFAMDDQNFDDLLAKTKSKEHGNKVHKFQTFAESTPDFVPDPYYGTRSDFQATFKIVENSAIRIAKKLKQIHEVR